MLKKIAIFVAAFGIAVGASVAGLAVAPAAAVEAVKPPPANPMDGCLCGGNGLTWTFVTREETGAFDKCWYDVRNGGVHAYYVVYTVGSNTPCPNLS